ncbi:MAG: SpoIIE family protein phosphatase [Bacteroidota bacterium]
MRRRFQIFLTFMMVLIFQISFWGFAFLSNKYIYDEIVEQVKNDNKVIGEQIIRLMQNTYLSKTDFETDYTLQHLCDSIKLPNGGFICAVDKAGNLVAGPGLTPGMTMSFTPTLQAYGQVDKFVPAELESDQTFYGFANFKTEGRTDLVSSIPLNEEVRLFVHQNKEIIEQRAAKYVKPLLLIGLIITIIAGFFTYFATNRIINKYESKIEVQNRELKDALEKIRLQKAEIEKTNIELEKQKNIAEEQHTKIAHQNKEITDSIQYARRIQHATLPKSEISKAIIDDHFILFMPRDIVSGDFYWYHEFDECVVITAVDCTGHGIPGAFMSMIGITFLNEIVVEKGIHDAGKILDELRKKVIHALGQKRIAGSTSDGMDMALCVIEKSTKKMKYAGAFNPLICIRNEELIEIKGSRMPIGIYGRMSENFETHSLQLENNDSIYLFSDGYTDQFGGSKGRKFLSKNFRHLLQKISNLPMEEQKQVLRITLKDWQGEMSQVDDILIIGFKVI